MAVSIAVGTLASLDRGKAVNRSTTRAICEAANERNEYPWRLCWFATLSHGAYVVSPKTTSIETTQVQAKLSTVGTIVVMLIGLVTGGLGATVTSAMKEQEWKTTSKMVQESHGEMIRQHDAELKSLQREVIDRLARIEAKMGGKP